MKKLILLMLIGIILLLPLGSSFMPKFTHKLVHEKSLETPIDSENYRACMKYPELCYSGNVLADVSVIFYYTASGSYVTTHNPPFCTGLLNNIAKVGLDSEKMRACAIGGCMHQPADIISHSKLGTKDGMVSYAIKHSLMINQIIHVFAEQKLDNYVEGLDEARGKETLSYLTYYKECQPLFETAMLGEPAYQSMSKAELDKFFDTFITEITNSQTGYDPAFKDKSFFVTLKSIPPLLLGLYLLIASFFIIVSLLLLLVIIRRNAKKRHYIALIVFLPIAIILVYLFVGSLRGSAFNNFITIIKPISNFVPIGGNQEYIDLAVENTKKVISSPDITSALVGTDASGMGSLPALLEANKSIIIYDYIILGVLILGFALWIYYLFKRNKINTSISF